MYLMHSCSMHTLTLPDNEYDAYDYMCCAHLQHVDKGLSMMDSLFGVSSHICACNQSVFAYAN